MFRWLRSSIFWGGLLILGGVLFLLQSLNILELGGLVWAILLGLGGLFFLSFFVSNRTHWWALIPGIILVSIGLLLVFEELAPNLAETWGASIVLGGIGVSFLAVYLSNRQAWWALIPMGVMLTLAIVIGLAGSFPTVDEGGLFLIGFAATFAVLALVPGQGGRMKWAWIPAGVLFLVGLGIVGTSVNLLVYIVPVILIIAGGWMVIRSLRSK